jgi:hypothetical protein
MRATVTPGKTSSNKVLERKEEESAFASSLLRCHRN